MRINGGTPKPQAYSCVLIRRRSLPVVKQKVCITANQCKFVITATSDNVCYVRFDIEGFSITLRFYSRAQQPPHRCWERRCADVNTFPLKLIQYPYSIRVTTKTTAAKQPVFQDRDNYHFANDE